MGFTASSYTNLPDRFFKRVKPTHVAAPKLLAFNTELADQLGIPQENPQTLADIFSGNILLPEFDPISQVYAGHQFGHFVPQLGDGRAILLAESTDIHHNTWDIQLKGPGITPFSRRGDGRYAIGPAIREYLVSEAMFALKIPTTRSLALVSTGETVYRETPVPGAVLTRIASSHIRVGTFEYFASQGDSAAVKILADYVIHRHYPDLVSAENPYIAFFEAISIRQAKLIASWMSVGFIHGVMNTDNMSVSGETIDYGPCAFLDEYHAQKVFSSIDHHGRYAFENQPGIAQWNLARLSECLLPLFNTDISKAVDLANKMLHTFKQHFQAEWLRLFSLKIGISNPYPEDGALIDHLLSLMQTHEADFTLTFYELSRNLSSPFFTHPDVQSWLETWKTRTQNTDASACMLKHNPVFIPRNHHIAAAISEMENSGTLTLFNELKTVLSNPFQEQPELDKYKIPPLPHERVTKTFCGT